MSAAQVVIRSARGRSVEAVVQEVLEGCGWEEVVPAGGRVVLKPNLSTPSAEMARCSNTDPDILEAVCRILLRRTPHVVVAESDGMRYKADEAFEIMGYPAIAERVGFRLVNLSRDEWREVNHPLLKGWPLPRTLLEADCLISLPVLKTRATTVFTGALKNQWGCLPQYNRLLLHRYLDPLIADINAILKPRLAVMDALIGMEGRGPINGEPVRMDYILGSRDLVALDATAMRFVRLEPRESRHIVLAAEAGLGQIAADRIAVDSPVPRWERAFKPAKKDLPIRVLALISYSKFLTDHLIFDGRFFYPLRRMAKVLRRIGVFGG